MIPKGCVAALFPFTSWCRLSVEHWHIRYPCLEEHVIVVLKFLLGGLHSDPHPIILTFLASPEPLIKQQDFFFSFWPCNDSIEKGKIDF